ncbi:MAG: CDP-diacylglycerol--glycerol-3-phosphate 3-phosphatidyltransferase [Phycisphaerae bacterium]|nr:CDP-diacylglycerol--glycerol-3-phosphate 3-phosphatidyltransferase [Phycisphaerae bacterium]
MKINLPNQITLGRLGLAILFFALLSLFDATQLDDERWLLHVCFWIFLVAALTDILDGLLARMMSSVTSFGRILDPVVDKVMVCGAFVLFASHHFWDPEQNVNITDVQPWMVVVILTRELLVSAVRSHAEAEGQEFGASWVGKLKMFVQSFTVCFILGQLAWKLDSLEPVRTACVWVTVIVTVLSALSYIHRARAFLLTPTALTGKPAEEQSPPKEATTPPDTPAQSGASPPGDES